MSIGLGIWCNFFPVNILMVIPVLGITVKSFMFFAAANITPSYGDNKQSFSWKYLQSLPLSRRELILFLAASNLINALPLLVWCLAFHPQFFSELGMKDYSFFHVFVALLMAMTFLMLAGFGSVKGSIELPVKLHMSGHRTVVFFNNLKSFLWKFPLVLLGMLGAVVLFSLFISKDEWLSSWPTPLLLLAICVAHYFYIIRCMEDEKFLYRKFHWNHLKDIPLTAFGLSLTAVPVLFYTMIKPSYLQGHEIYSAIEANEQGKVRSMIENGIDPNMKNKAGATPLLVAAKAGNFELVKYLELKGAKRTGDLDNYGVLLLAIQSKNVALVDYLLKTGANPNEKSWAYQDSALHVAAATCSGKLVDLLIKKGAKIDPLTKQGRSPLHIAVRKNCTQSTIALLEHGIDPSIKDKDGKIALDYVKQTESSVAYLLEKRTRLPASKR